MSEFLFTVVSLLARILDIASRHDHEFLFMAGGTWAQLWSGIFGAVIGALAAAAVALLVVWLSNRHQRVLADAAMQEQRRLAGEALREQQRLAGEALAEQRRLSNVAATEQRNLADKAARAQTIQYHRELSEQRRSVQLQLEEQRREASKARELDAVADAMAAVAELVSRYAEGGREIDAAIQSMRSAVFRWAFEHPIDSEGRELKWWPHHLAMLAYATLKAERATPPAADAQFAVLNNASNVFLTLVSAWPAADADYRTTLIKALERARLNPSAESSVAELFAQ